MPYAAHVVITVPAGNVTGSVTDYPLLFSGTFSYLATVANGGAVTSSSGFDIIFTSDAAGTVILDFEKVFYRATDGTVEFRIRTQQTSGVAYVVYLFYGNSSVTSYLGTTGTWASAWRAVWHLGDSSGLSGADSTANGNTGTPTGSPTAVSGQIGNGIAFTGSTSALDLVNTTSIRVNPPFAFRFWVNPSSYNTAGGVVIFLKDSLGNFNYIVAVSATGKAEFVYINGAFTVILPDTTTLPLNTWTHVTILVRAPGLTNVNFYINDVFSSTQTSAIAVPASFPGGVTQIGNGGAPNSQLDAALDELQLYSGTLSTTMRSMLYANESSPSTFFGVASNTAWTSTAVCGLGVVGAFQAVMSFGAAAACGLVLAEASTAALGYSSAAVSGAIAFNSGGEGRMAYNSPAGTVPLVIDVNAVTSTGTVPITCISGSGTGAAVIPPGVDPGWAY